MKSKGMLLTALGCLGAMAVLGQAPAQQPAAPAAPQTGPGVQAPSDAKYAEFVAAKCKTPPPARGAGGGNRGPAAAGPGGPGGAAAGANAAAAGAPAHREYTVTAIPGVIAAGQTWKTIWTGTGNNADGILATKDGGILAAQNTDSAVLKIDKNNKVSTPYKDTKTGGALAMSKKGELYVVSRGLPTSVIQLEPKRRTLADTYMGEPLDCIGGVINDLTADSKGGVYFTMGGVYYANSKGVVTKYGTLTGVNGIILSVLLYRAAFAPHTVPFWNYLWWALYALLLASFALRARRLKRRVADLVIQAALHCDMMRVFGAASKPAPK